MKAIISLFLSILYLTHGYGQDLYSDSTVLKFELQFSQLNYWDLLVQNKQPEIDIPATLIVNDSETYDSVGVRFKGNSSYNMSGEKKSFNISIDSFLDDQRLWEYKTLNLNNCFMDPTFIREKISYDIFRKYMPASHVGFVSLYLNGEYWGLYVNVEQINKDFLSEWFSSNEGNLYKGDPHGTMEWRGLGAGPYKNEYEKKTNEEEDDWTDLISFVDVLNNSMNLEDYLPEVLNVDRALWYIALCNIMINLDSYIFSTHNYYIYNNPKTGQFNMLPWDLNESFGCFPGNMNQIQFEQFSIFHNSDNTKCPLLNKLFDVTAYRALYFTHYRTILHHEFHPDSLLPRIETFQSLIDSYVESDSKKLYPYEFFHENVFTSVMVQGNRTAPGIINLVQNRRDFLLQSQDILQQGPDIQLVTCFPDNPNVGSSVVFTADLFDNAGVMDVILYYRIGMGSFSAITMLDNGQYEDVTAGDGIFTCSLNIPDGSAGDYIEFYIFAENGLGTVSLLPEKAQFECFRVRVEGRTELADLVINEFMAGNDNTIQDPQGDYDDWIELYNRSSQAISLQGMSLTDDPEEPEPWIFPDTLIQGYSYLVIWADSDEEDSPGLHTNFKLNKDGEYIGLYDTGLNNYELIDSYTFGKQEDDISEGRIPNGEGYFTFMTIPTPGIENLETGVADIDDHNVRFSFDLFQNYPNPFNSSTIIEYSLDKEGEVHLGVYNMRGRLVKQLINSVKMEGNYSVLWNGTDQIGLPVASGIYLYQLESLGKVVKKKLVFVQ